MRMLRRMRRWRRRRRRKWKRRSRRKGRRRIRRRTEKMGKEEVEVKEKEQQCFLVKASQVLASCSHNRVLGRQPSLHRPIPGQ